MSCWWNEREMCNGPWNRGLLLEDTRRKSAIEPMFCIHKVNKEGLPNSGKSSYSYGRIMVVQSTVLVISVLVHYTFNGLSCTSPAALPARGSLQKW